MSAEVQAIAPHIVGVLDPERPAGDRWLAWWERPFSAPCGPVAWVLDPVTGQRHQVADGDRAAWAQLVERLLAVEVPAR